MKTKQYIRARWRDNVCKIYRSFRSDTFTAADVNTVVNMTPGEKAGMFNGLRCGGILIIENGGRRGFYHKTPSNKRVNSTRWLFAPWFCTYMENGGLEEMEQGSA